MKIHCQHVFHVAKEGILLP